MPGYFPKNPSILFIGQNPGQLYTRLSGWSDLSYANKENYQEFQQGYRHGLLEAPLGKWIVQGIQRNTTWALTNVIKCRTPNNTKPTDEEIENCRPWLRRQIKLLKPKVIVTLGNPAYEWFNLMTPIDRVRGKAIHVELEFWDGVMIPMYHPAFNQYKHDKFTLRQMLGAEAMTINNSLYLEAMEQSPLPPPHVSLRARR